MAEQYSDREPVWYGPGNSGLGMWAFHVFVDFSTKDAPVRADGERRWYVSDHETLFYSMNLEGHVRREGLPADAPEEVRAELHGYLDSWRGALPFNESERVVVARAYEGVRGRYRYREIPGQLRRAEYEMVSSGLHTVVRGRDLMQRWWTWRRELDQFAGQGNLAEAQEAARDLTGRLVPPNKMPDIYYELQGIERPVPYSRDTY